jgi:hypothetical protein
MKVFVLKARVKLHSLAKIEANLLGDPYDETETDTFLGWRKVSEQLQHIRNIVQYDKDKCMVYTYYEPYEYLVKEAYSQLHKRWADAKKADDSDTISSENDEYEDEDDEDEKD